MKGQILHIDAKTGDGVICTTDGQRYAFGETDLLGDGQRLALPGVAVDFQPSGSRAAAIYPDPGAPAAAPVIGEKNRMVAGLLALFLGSLGVHKFYLGRTRAGLVMLAAWALGWMLFFVPTLVVWAISTVEAVIYMTRSDAQFHETYQLQGKDWF